MTETVLPVADEPRNVPSAGPNAGSARQRAATRGVELAARDLALAGGGLSRSEALSAFGRGAKQFDASDMLGYLLYVELPDGRDVYPAFQFTDFSFLQRMKLVREELPSGNGWFVLNFLVHPDPLLDGRTPLDLLRTDDWKLVIGSARAVGHMGS